MFESKVTSKYEIIKTEDKLSEYKIPTDTYFYDSKTSGENIIRYNSYRH